MYQVVSGHPLQLWKILRILWQTLLHQHTCRCESKQILISYHLQFLSCLKSHLFCSCCSITHLLLSWTTSNYFRLCLLFTKYDLLGHFLNCIFLFLCKHPSKLSVYLPPPMLSFFTFYTYRHLFSVYLLYLYVSYNLLSFTKETIVDLVFDT